MATRSSTSRSASAASRWARLSSLGMALRAASRPGAPGLTVRLRAVPRMISAALQGRYAGLTAGRALALVAAALYVVSPVDLVPEALFGVFGLADDAMLVSWLASSLLGDTEAFLAWESGQGGTPAAGTGGTPWQAESPQDAWRPADEPVRSYVVR